MTRMILIVGVLMVMFAGLGCNMFDSHVKDFDLMRGMATDASTRLQDGSVSQMQVSGQAINPGVTVEAAIKYTATARYEGLAGQFGAASQGTLGPRTLPPEIAAIINDKTLTDAARWAKILNLYETVVGESAESQPAEVNP